MIDYISREDAKLHIFEYGVRHRDNGSIHGHYRGNREKPKKVYRQHKRAKRKLVKASRRRNRK